MPIIQQGQLNTTAVVVPDTYVQIVPPQNLFINGVPTNVLGVVGSASWGPVGQAQIVSSMADYTAAFGPMQARKYDMGTQVGCAVQQGASNFRCVRVTDGTDTAAVCVFGYTAPGPWVAGGTIAAFNFVSSNGAVWQAQSGGQVGTTAPSPSGLAVNGSFNDGRIVWRLVATTPTTQSLAIVSLYTGSFGNSIQVSLVPGSKAGTWRLVIAPPGAQPEVFDNIPTTGLFWLNLQLAVNNGQLQYGRGPSKYVIATGGSGGNAGQVPLTSSTWNGTNTSTGTGIASGMIMGTDGSLGVTATAVVGADTLPRTGMYALRGQGCSVALLADVDDSSQWSVQVAFGLGEGCYMVLVGPAGDTIPSAIGTKAAAGLDSFVGKVLFGDWLWWNDQANGQLRLVSPQGFIAGRLANLSPQNSSLNKPIYGVVGSQKSGVPGSGQAQAYSTAELQSLLGAGIEVICNPQPGGTYWGARGGHNSSSAANINGDNYTRMTNYLATTLNAGMGLYVGRPINLELFQNIRGTLIGFLQGMLSQGLLGTLDGSLPYGVVCDPTNNPASRTSLGYVQADVQVQYQAINEKFIINIEGGQTVTITKQTLPFGQ